MQEIYRAFVVVLLIALFVYAFAKKAITQEAIAPEDFARRRNLWFAVTAVLFLSNNFWVFMVVSGGMLLVAVKRESNPVALLFASVLAVPLISAQVGAFGIVNYLFELNFFRLFSLLILFPAYLVLRAHPLAVPFGKTAADRFLLGYILLRFGMELPTGNYTNALRQGFNLFLDIFLPYYVASRALRSVESFRDALSTYVVVAAVLGAIGVFEFGKSWLLYSNLPTALDAPWGLGQYLSRGESLRALASTGQPLVLGFMLAVCFCFYLFVRESIASPTMRVLGFVGIMGCLVAPVSRGPWLGALAGYVLYLALTPNGLGTLAKRGVVGFALFLLVLASPFGGPIIDLLPFVGKVDAVNVTYRQDLLTNSLVVIARHPWLGALDFIKAPEMEALRWGGDDGIIDIVNSYIFIALAYGVVGLGLFLGFMVSVMLGVYKSMRLAVALDGSMAMLGRTLLATMGCIAITIYTVSSISYISIVFWVVFGLGAAYQSMVSRAAAVLGKQVPVPPATQAAPAWRPSPLPVAPRSEAPLARAGARQPVMPLLEPTREMPLYDEATQHLPLHDEATQLLPLFDAPTRQIGLNEEPTRQVPLHDEPTRRIPLNDEPTQHAPLRD